MYNLHTTRKVERDLLMARDGERIEISPKEFQVSIPMAKAIICEEDTKKIVQHEPYSFFDLLGEIEKDPHYDFTQSNYYISVGHGHGLDTRCRRLPALLADIKAKGVLNPVQCEVTGERLDGSYRTKISMYLGTEKVPAILHRFLWTDIDEDFIERKLMVRQIANGRDYYEFEYGYKGWKNITNGGAVYRENAERADVIIPLITGQTVLDIGCNEGYISIQAARKGKSVVGIDRDLIPVAWLNRLIFEFVDKKDMDAKFYEEDAETTTRTADTILMLNVLYHLSPRAQKRLIMQYKGKQMIFQCNLRKAHVREQYYTSHPDDLKKLLDECGVKYRMIEWKDKPIIITQ